MKTRRILKIATIALLSIVVVLATGGFILSRYALKKAALRLKAMNASIESANVNLFNQSVTFENIKWTYADDSLSTIPHQVSIKQVRVSGISLYKFIRFKKIRIGTLAILDGSAQFNKAIKRKKEQDVADQVDLTDIEVDRLVLKNINTTILNDSVPEYSATVNLSLNDVQLKDFNLAKDISAYEIKSFELRVTRLRINEKDAMYNTHVAQVYANSYEKKIVVDSILLIPRLSKYKFSRKVGRQIDRFNLLVPNLTVNGFIFNDVKDSLFAASTVEINDATLHVFRDKRLPFIKEKNTPLPVALIRSFSFEVAVDSVKIKNASITYEEFPEKGFRTGRINFKNLNATLDHISNRDYYSNYKQATLKVVSRVMGKGMIKAEFSLPYGKEQVYNAKGTITNLPLHHLNPILESLAFISIESGTLNQLNFDFDYNDIRSRGSMLLNYKDLRISGLTHEKESVTNELKTWVLNVFLKKDKDHTVSVEKRMGTIDFVRDRRRAIFNVWVRSIFTGLKSSVMDLPAKKEKENTKVRENKKERRKDEAKKTDKKAG